MSMNQDADKKIEAALRAEYGAWAESLKVPPVPRRRESPLHDWLTLATAAAVLVVALPLSVPHSGEISPLGQMVVRTLQDQRAVQWSQDIIGRAGRDMQARFAPGDSSE